ncbi:MAG: RNA pseudouridine synthase [Myxococcota bacterium]
MDDLTPRVLYVDERIVAVDKPVGIAAIPERDLAVPSVQRALEAARGERLWVVHRLDKEVSGLLVFARTAEAHRHLSLAFERRQVDKAYLALLVGLAAGDPGQTFTIAHPIHEFGSGRMGVDPRGKPSTTHWQALAHAAADSSSERVGAGHTLVLARPATGRRHQLRVHFYAVGHPIAGDPRYGDHAAQAAYPRLMLHARSLVLPMPDRPPLALSAPPDAAFLAVLRAHGIAADALGPEP